MNISVDGIALTADNSCCVWRRTVAPLTMPAIIIERKFEYRSQPTNIFQTQQNETTERMRKKKIHSALITCLMMHLSRNIRLLMSETEWAWGVQPATFARDYSQLWIFMRFIVANDLFRNLVAELSAQF